MASLIYDNFRAIKIEKTFDGTIASGAEDSETDISVEGVNPTLFEGEYVYDVFYRVTTPFNSSPTIYLEAGIKTDDQDCILDGTTGILDTLNSNSTGLKSNPVAYTKSTIEGRDLILVPKNGDITAGVIELTLVIAKNDLTSEAIEFGDTRDLNTPPPSL